MDALEMVDNEIRRMDQGWAPPLSAAYAATLAVVRAEIARLTAAIEERDAEIERLRGDSVRSADAAYGREMALHRRIEHLGRPTPTLAEVAMHLHASYWAMESVPVDVTTRVLHSIHEAEDLLAELKKREG